MDVKLEWTTHPDIYDLIGVSDKGIQWLQIRFNQNSIGGSSNSLRQTTKDMINDGLIIHRRNRLVRLNKLGQLMIPNLFGLDSEQYNR